MLRFSGFEIDSNRGELRAPQGETIKLRPKTFALLHLFATNANRLLSKQELMSAIWPNVQVNDDSLFQCIREIRTALGDKDRQLVKSISGRGYLFEADVVAGDANARALLLPPTPGEAAPSPEADSIRRRVPRRSALAASLVVCFVIGAAFAAPQILRRINNPQEPLTIAVMPIEARTEDGASALMAASVTDQLTDGLSRIGNIRVIAPRAAENAARTTLASSGQAGLILSGNLKRGATNWEIEARLTDSRTGAVRWSSSQSIAATNTDEKLQESRLASGIGYPVALQINRLDHALLPSADSKIVIEQANAFINSTSRERAAAAQDMLEKALAKKPDDVDLEAALASQLLRGIQTAWYTPTEADDAEQRARFLLETALKHEPSYIPVMQAYCRLLTATNHFLDSLIACEKALDVEPWDGQVLFQIGLSQLQLGRFEDALATFQRANILDTPQISRWTWLLGEGLTLVHSKQYEAAVPWLERSLAVTMGTGRTHMVLAAADQALGRFDDARKNMAKALELRPGSTVGNVLLPLKNTSARYRASADVVMNLMVSAGLPEH